MQAIIDLDSELIVDRSRIFDPYLRLFFAAIGQKLAKGSPWVVVSKRVMAQYETEARNALEDHPCRKQVRLKKPRELNRWGGKLRREELHRAVTLTGGNQHV